MSERINLVLLYGGKSGEHEISLMSAASVLANLDSEKYRITPIGISKNGLCYVNEYEALRAHQQALPVSTASSVRLDSLLSKGQFALEADVVFPVIHGPLYEDGCLQGVLTSADVAYVGCDVLSSAIGMDKDMARRVACVNGLKSARYEALSSQASEAEIGLFCQRVIDTLGWPLFVKPCSMGSSVGIHKAENKKELLYAIRDARRYDVEVLVEEFIQGREIELAVLESQTPGARPDVSLAGEIAVHHPDGFYSYAAKYLDCDSSGLHAPTVLDKELLVSLQQAAADIFVRLKCKGMARVDFFVGDKTQEIYFNEINTLPGFTAISMYPKLWQASGMSYSGLLDRLVELAMARQHVRRQIITHYQ